MVVSKSLDSDVLVVPANDLKRSMALMTAINKNGQVRNDVWAERAIRNKKIDLSDMRKEYFPIFEEKKAKEMGAKTIKALCEMDRSHSKVFKDVMFYFDPRMAIIENKGDELDELNGMISAGDGKLLMKPPNATEKKNCYIISQQQLLENNPEKFEELCALAKDGPGKGEIFSEKMLFDAVTLQTLVQKHKLVAPTVKDTGKKRKSSLPKRDEAPRQQQKKKAKK